MSRSYNVFFIWDCVYSQCMIDRVMKSVQEMYDDSGVLWDATRRKTYGSSQNWPVIQKYLDTVTPGMTLLDVGCGNGRLISGVTPGVSYTGYDFSRSLLAKARNNYPSYDFRYGDITDESVWKTIGMYDAAFCIAVLHHLPTRAHHISVLTQIKKRLLPGGFLCVTVWNLQQAKFDTYHSNSSELKQTDARWVEIPFAGKWKRFCFSMDIPYLSDIAAEAGLTIVELYYSDSAGNASDAERGRNIILIAR